MEKKRLLTLAIVGLFLSGCGTATPNEESSAQSEVVSESQVESSSESSVSASEPADETASVMAYFPFKENVASTYIGEGNEYMSYAKYPQYIEDNRIQFSKNNGGTQIVEVLEYVDGALIKVFERPETYFRENMLNKKSEEGTTILLQEPLKVGTAWNSPSGSVSEITAIDAIVETALGTYAVIEVTTTEEDTITKSYYAEGIGLVKEVFTDTAGTYETSSTLDTREEGVPETALVQAFYPDANVMGLEMAEVNVSFNTNDVTRKTLTDLFKQIPDVEYGRLIPDSATINSLYINEDGRVYVDFNAALVTDMNAGSSGESLLLQGIVNTIGNYYGVEEIILTVDNEPYESGHFSFDKDEVMRVDMGDVIE